MDTIEAVGVVTPNLAAFVRSASIYVDERFSDHAPLTIGYDLDWNDIISR